MVCLTQCGNLAPWQTQYKQHYFQKLINTMGVANGEESFALPNPFKQVYKMDLDGRPLESAISSASVADRAIQGLDLESSYYSTSCISK